MINSKKFFQFLFFIGYFLLIIAVWYSKITYFSTCLKIFNIVSVVIFLFLILMQIKSYNFKDLIIILFFTLIVAINYYISKDVLLIRLFLVIFASKNLDFDSFIKVDIKFRFLMFISLFVLCYFGLAEDVITYRSDGLIRHSFGFVHPNHVAYHFMILFMEFIYLFKGKITLKKIIFLLPVIYIINYFSDSRSSLLIFILLILFVTFYDFFVNSILSKKIIKKIIKNSFFIFALVSLILVKLYKNNNNIGLLFNELFSQRIRYIVKFLNMYNYTLFGNNIEFVSINSAIKYGVSSMVLDNCYFKILLQYGFVIFILFSYLFYKTINHIYKNKNYKLLFIYFCLLIFGLFEYRIIEIESNPFLLIIGCYILSRRNLNESNKEKLNI